MALSRSRKLREPASEVVPAASWVVRSASGAGSGLAALPVLATDAEAAERPQGLGLDAGAAKLSAKGATGRGPAAGAGLLLAP